MEQGVIAVSCKLRIVFSGQIVLGVKLALFLLLFETFYSPQFQNYLCFGLFVRFRLTRTCTDVIIIVNYNGRRALLYVPIVVVLFASIIYFCFCTVLFF